MATKKTEAPENTAELAEAAAPEEKKDPWAEEVEIIVPRKPKSEDQFYYVCVNDRRFSIPADGKKQRMPAPIAKVLQMGIDAEYKAEDFANEMSRQAAENARSIGL